MNRKERKKLRRKERTERKSNVEEEVENRVYIQCRWLISGCTYFFFLLFSPTDDEAVGRLEQASAAV